MSNCAKTKPHAVLIPFPAAQGHVNAMFKFAKLLHLRDFHITFVNTEYTHKRLLKSSGPNSLDDLTDFDLETIPDDLTPMEGDEDVTPDVSTLIQSILTNFLQPFGELLAKLHDSSNVGLVPPVTCIVSDCYMPFTIEVAEEYALPIVLFSPCSASTFLVTSQCRKGILPLKDESDKDNKDGDWIPSLKTTNSIDMMIKLSTEVADKCHRASAIVINTSYKLESDAMNTLYSMFPSIYTIGPFASFVNQSPQNHLVSLNSNLWKEDTKCLEWLESKEPGSVLYVNFGSTTVMSQEKLLEFAWGLANSKKSFLWIIRPDLVIGGSVVMSSDFLNETSDRGLIASWCPQDKVLNHTSIGGFLTHCGWNSTTESICAGVPMLCWPFFGDQPLNCRFICKELGIGIEIDANVKRDEVEKVVNELMVEEKGKKMRQKAMELKKMVEEDTRPGGCSYMNLDKVTKDVLLKNY